MDLVSALSSTRNVTAAAIFTFRREVIGNNMSQAAEALTDVIATARHVLFRTDPPVRLIDVAFAESRVLLIPFGRDVVVVRGDRALEVSDVLACVRSGDTREGNSEVSDISKETPRPNTSTEGLEDGIAIVMRAVMASRACVGGAVIRNYLKKAQAELAESHPSLGTMHVELDGRVTQAEGSRLESSAAREWATALITRVRRIAPDLTYETK
jgi:hypothetical protein